MAKRSRRTQNPAFFLQLTIWNEGVSPFFWQSAVWIGTGHGISIFNSISYTRTYRANLIGPQQSQWSARHLPNRNTAKKQRRYRNISGHRVSAETCRAKDVVVLHFGEKYEPRIWPKRLKWFNTRRRRHLNYLHCQSNRFYHHQLMNLPILNLLVLALCERALHFWEELPHQLAALPFAPLNHCWQKGGLEIHELGWEPRIFDFGYQELEVNDAESVP